MSSLAEASISVQNRRGKVLSDFRALHAGATVVVCGCGESLNLLTRPEARLTIGVNDVGRRFDPTYLVVLNPPGQFARDRFSFVRGSRASYIFSQRDDLGLATQNLVKLKLGRLGGTDPWDQAGMPYAQNSPYVAVCLAAFMGARRIGLIGVDFTDHHFFANTGPHPLRGQLRQIDEQYGKLRNLLRERGVELFNLSPASHLARLPKMLLDDFDAQRAAQADAQTSSKPASRVFFVNYRFLACGEVFATGLRNGAAEAGVDHQESWWDDPRLPEKIRAFRPDLLFVVHGRRFAERWNGAFREYRSAVWLLDEPYEVDDTAKWSDRFDVVFANDPSTLTRHRNAHYLPVCFDPRVHADAGLERCHKVGFIGGYNRTREQYLLELAKAGLLSYVVGGPWRNDAVNRLCLSRNIPAEQTACLYQQTKVVVNVFRDVHHYNRDGVAGWSMNPRVYEALACGAAVVSEARAELNGVFPEIPTFKSAADLVTSAAELVKDASRREEVLVSARAKLAQHSYAARLRTALEVAVSTAVPNGPQSSGGAARSLALVRKPAPPADAAITRPTARVSETRSRSARPVRTPKRNLLYHIWPVRGSTWRWNVDQLLRRIDLFNGRRVVSIFHDARSEPPEVVRDLLAPHGFEFLVAPNDARAEGAAFPALLEKVKSEVDDQVTFYAHAKGVRHEPRFPDPLKKWVDTLYRVNLDDWPSVRAQLDRYPMTGAFKMQGQFRIHQNLGDWHYSGTFFWFRNADVFGREGGWKAPDFYFGVEAWPGILFPATDTGCLLLDNLRRIPYDERFWREIGDRAVTTWQTRQRGMPPPSDLAQPRSYDGHAWPRLEQVPEEFDWWIGLMLQERASSLLNIGAGQGGVEWHVARKFREAGRDISITCVDKEEHPELKRSLDDIRARFGQQVELIRGDSGSQDTVARLLPQYDAVFIDADHGYRSVARDCSVALSRKPRVLGLHDIVDSDWHAGARCCVSRVWDALRSEYETQERGSGDWGGIGVVWPDRRRGGEPHGMHHGSGVIWANLSQASEPGA